MTSNKAKVTKLPKPFTLRDGTTLRWHVEWPWGMTWRVTLVDTFEHAVNDAHDMMRWATL